MRKYAKRPIPSSRKAAENAEEDKILKGFSWRP